MGCNLRQDEEIWRIHIECRNFGAPIYHQCGSSHQCMVCRYSWSFRVIKDLVRACLSGTCAKNIPHHPKGRLPVGLLSILWCLLVSVVYGRRPGRSGYSFWLLWVPFSIFPGPGTKLILGKSLIWLQCAAWSPGLVSCGPVSAGTMDSRRRVSIAGHFRIWHLFSLIYHTVGFCPRQIENTNCFII
jgi:hypothetical protein